MNTFSQILAHWSDHREQLFALVTITRTQGSTYRKTGTRMLVDFQGRTYGMMSGGCLEEEIALRAKRVMRQNQATMASFDTRRLFGCNGVLDVLIEPLCREIADGLLPAAQQCFAKRAALVGTTLFETNGNTPGPAGSYALFSEDGARFSERSFPESFSIDATYALENPGILERSYELHGGSMKALLQTIAPPLRLMICGAGPDVTPLATFARQLGWETSVVMVPSQSAPDLPNGCRRLCLAPEEITEAVRADARTFAVVMSHNYGRDLAFLSAVLSMPFRYVGLLGPASRRQRLLCDLGGMGLLPHDESLENLHSPAGLDIGADGPEEVALSIISEIQAVANGRAGGLLRHRPGPIHTEAAAVV